MKYWLTYSYVYDPAQACDMDGEEVFDTLDEALERVNGMGDRYSFRLIEGRVLKLTPVQVVTKYEVER